MTTEKQEKNAGLPEEESLEPVQEKTETEPKTDAEEIADFEAEAEDYGAPELEIRYDLNGEEIYKALSIYHKEMLWKKNIIYTVLLTLIAGFYSYDMIRGLNRNWFTVVLLILCAAVIFMVWFVPYKHRKAMAKGADLTETEFTMDVYSDFLLVKQAVGNIKMVFHQDPIAVTETDSIFIISIGKEKLYVLPKRCLNDETTSRLQEIFKAGTGDKYKVLEAKK